MSGLVVALLRVADLRPEVDEDTGAVRTAHHGLALPDQDAAALELALRAGALRDWRVLVVAAGGPEIEPALAEIAALGADVVRVPLPPGLTCDVHLDEHALARALVSAMGQQRPDLVVCGDRSSDRGTGALPAFVAHELGVAQALGLVSLTVAGTSIRAERRLDGGRRELLEVTGPAVVSVEAAGVRLRRAPLRCAAASARALAPVADPPPPGHEVHVDRVRPFSPRTQLVPPPKDGPAGLRLLELTGALAHPEPPTVVGPLDAAAAADVLVDFLRRHGYLEESS